MSVEVGMAGMDMKHEHDKNDKKVYFLHKHNSSSSMVMNVLRWEAGKLVKRGG